MEDDFRRNLAIFKSKRIYIVEPEACLRILIDSTGTNAFQAKFVSLGSDKLTLQEFDGKTIECRVADNATAEKELAAGRSQPIGGRKEYADDTGNVTKILEWFAPRPGLS